MEEEAVSKAQEIVGSGHMTVDVSELPLIELLFPDIKE